MLWVTDRIESVFERLPQPGEAMAVAEGIYWLRMPLPFALDHINLWLIEGERGWTLIDTGIANEETRGHWQEVAQRHFGGRPVERLIVTHFHPDHVGLAGWLTEQWRVPLWMTQSEWLHARMLSLDTSPDMMAEQLAFYRRAGCPPEFLEATRERGPAYASRVSAVPLTYRRLRGGEELDLGGRLWRVIIGRGHAPEHACLHCPELGLLISGDQVLPKISPNVGVYLSEPEADPLSDFLESLRLLEGLPGDTLVLPSHNTPFRGLPVRLRQLREHHEERLNHLLSVLDAPKTAMELAKSLFKRPLDRHQTGFAIGETLAHLHRLRATGSVESWLDQEGRTRFQRSAQGGQRQVL